MATAGNVFGRNLLLYLNGNAIANSKSASLSINANLVDATTKDSSGWMEYEAAGNKGATLSTDALLALDASYTADDIFTLLSAGTTVTWRYSTNTTGDYYFTGSAKVADMSLSANDGDLMQYSITLNVTGAVTNPTLT